MLHPLSFSWLATAHLSRQLGVQAELHQGRYEQADSHSAYGIQVGQLLCSGQVLCAHSAVQLMARHELGCPPGSQFRATLQEGRECGARADIAELLELVFQTLLKGAWNPVELVRVPLQKLFFS